MFSQYTEEDREMKELQFLNLDMLNIQIKLDCVSIWLGALLQVTCFTFTFDMCNFHYN